MPVGTWLGWWLATYTSDLGRIVNIDSAAAALLLVKNNTGKKEEAAMLDTLGTIYPRSSICIPTPGSKICTDAILAWQNGVKFLSFQTSNNSNCHKNDTYLGAGKNVVVLCHLDQKSGNLQPPLKF